MNTHQNQTIQSNKSKYNKVTFLLICVLILLFVSQSIFAKDNNFNRDNNFYRNDKNSKIEWIKAQKRKELRAVFEDTKAAAQLHSRGLNKNITSQMIKGTKAYHTRKNGNLLSLKDQKEITAPSKGNRPIYRTLYTITDRDSFNAAKKLKDQGLNPLVLNMANKNVIGGGVERGSSAQEETLFRSSNYHLALYPHKRAKNPKGTKPYCKRYLYPIQEFGSYYTPSVQVFRDSAKKYGYIKPFTVSCIAIAGYDLSQPAYLEKRLIRKGQVDLGAFKFYTKLKIRHLLEVAMHKGHDSLVLGAISCGAFRLAGDNNGLTARLVAEAYEEVLKEPQYQGRFKNVTFAVLPKGEVGRINYDVFSRMVGKL